MKTTKFVNFHMVFSLMGLPIETDWPQDSQIGRQAFENCRQPIITLERLVRFPDSCAFDLLRVSFSDSLTYVSCTIQSISCSF